MLQHVAVHALHTCLIASAWSLHSSCRSSPVVLLWTSGLPAGGWYGIEAHSSLPTSHTSAAASTSDTAVVGMQHRQHGSIAQAWHGTA